MRTHGHACGRSPTPTYVSWAAMRARCTQPSHPKFALYGGRGISVCDRWQTFENFLADMGERPEGTTLDRHPNRDGNYEPGNCRWATDSEQNSHRSNNHLLTLEGVTLTVAAWARRVGLSKSTLRMRLAAGWSTEAALTTPLATEKSHRRTA